MTTNLLWLANIVLRFFFSLIRLISSTVSVSVWNLFLLFSSLVLFVCVSKRSGCFIRWIAENSQYFRISSSKNFHHVFSVRRDYFYLFTHHLHHSLPLKSACLNIYCIHFNSIKNYEKRKKRKQHTMKWQWNRHVQHIQISRASHESKSYEKKNRWRERKKKVLAFIFI